MTSECLETQRTTFRRLRSVIGIASVFRIEDQIEVSQYLGSLGQYLGSKLRSKMTGFEIEVGLTGTGTKRVNW